MRTGYFALWHFNGEPPAEWHDKYPRSSRLVAKDIYGIFGYRKEACFPPDPYIIFDRRKAETLWREIIMGGSFGGCYWGDYVNRLHVLLSF